ncbi:MAG: hypothetical protein HY747_04000 [Elusimicrobia bacterium]|nr:hypothetical protein [Elusimicrobiota bacterium]
MLAIAGAGLAAVVIFLLGSYMLRRIGESLVSCNFLDFCICIFLASELVVSRLSMQPELFGFFFLIFFWANFHASFAFAFCILGLQIGARLFTSLNLGYKDGRFREHLADAWPEVRGLSALLAIGFFATLINPYGLALYSLFFYVFKDAKFFQTTIAEWQTT